MFFCAGQIPGNILSAAYADLTAAEWREIAFMANITYRIGKSEPKFSIALQKKTSLIVYAATFVIAVFLRADQLLHNVNFNTGRYIDENPMKNYPVGVIFIGMVCIAVILLFGKSKDKVIKSVILINPWRLRYDRLNKKISHVAAYACLLMCLLIAVEIVVDISAKVSYNKLIREELPEDIARDYSVFTGMTAVNWIIYFLMLLVFLTFLSMAINIFQGQGISRANCAALTTFAFWKILELYTIFSTNTVIAVSSEKVYILLSTMATTLFFLFTARFFMGLEKKYTRFWMCFTGYLASILSGVSVIPRYIMLLTSEGYDDRLNMGVPAVSDIGMVFTTITIVAVFWSTYAYRVMPKRVGGCKRWTMNARPKDLSMKAIDVPDDPKP